MALLAVSDDALGIISGLLCNVLEPHLAVDFGSATRGLWALTQALRRQLRAEHEPVLALCLKVGLRSCKELREAKMIDCRQKLLSEADLTTLGMLGSVLPKLEQMHFLEIGPDSVQQLAEGLGAGALPALATLALVAMPVSDAGASALAAALGRGALPRLQSLLLTYADISDAGLVALAPALRRRPALGRLYLCGTECSDESITALVAPPPPAGALPPPTAVLAKLKRLDLSDTQISDAGCAALAFALDSGSLPALENLLLDGIPASAAAKATVQEALQRSMLRKCLDELVLATPLKV